jgi:hypothetical protein
MKKALGWAVLLQSVLGSCWWIAEFGYAPGPALVGVPVVSNPREPKQSTIKIQQSAISSSVALCLRGEMNFPWRSG